MCGSCVTPSKASRQAGTATSRMPSAVRNVPLPMRTPGANMRQNGEHDRDRAGALEDAHGQLGRGVHDREVVQVVVVETELAQRR